MSQSPLFSDINNNKSVINALKTGEKEVFDAVYRHYFRRLCAFCSQYITEQEEIEEIVQETMIWLWENRSGLLPELTLKTLLFTIVKNKSLNRISHFEIKRKVHQEIVEKYKDEFCNPDFYLDELLELYEKALKQLPNEYREAYEMNRNQLLTHKEIAKKLKVSTQLVNYRIGQALKYLRMALKDYLPLFMLCFGSYLLKKFQ